MKIIFSIAFGIFIAACASAPKEAARTPAQAAYADEQLDQRFLSTAILFEGFVAKDFVDSRTVSQTYMNDIQRSEAMAQRDFLQKTKDTATHSSLLFIPLTYAYLEPGESKAISGGMLTAGIVGGIIMERILCKGACSDLEAGAGSLTGSSFGMSAFAMVTGYGLQRREGKNAPAQAEGMRSRLDEELKKASNVLTTAFALDDRQSETLYQGLRVEAFQKKNKQIDAVKVAISLGLVDPRQADALKKMAATTQEHAFQNQSRLSLEARKDYVERATNALEKYLSFNGKLTEDQRSRFDRTIRENRQVLSLL